MPFTTIAYYQSVDPAGVDVRLPPVLDPTVRISGNDLYVPALNKLMAAAAMVCITGGLGIARLTSPSLLRLARTNIAPIQGAAAAASLPGDPPSITVYEAGGIQLATNEGLDVIINSDPAAAQIQAVVAWLCDQFPAEVNPGDVFTLRATGATALVAGSWINVPLTFDDAIPVGKYSIVGMRAQSATMLAGRLVVPGFAWRPGVLGCLTSSHRDDRRFRMGNLGEFAQFDSLTLFSVECLAEAADATQVFEFDVAKIA
jgi:hypothetical protein